MSTLFIILLFGSGMPVLYVIGACYFGVTFIVNKILILKYYKRTRTMNRTIPDYSISLLPLGLVVHMLGAAFMLTNPEPFQAESDSGVLAHFNAVHDVKGLAEFYEDKKDSEFGHLLFYRFELLH